MGRVHVRSGDGIFGCGGIEVGMIEDGVRAGSCGGKAWIEGLLDRSFYCKAVD